MNNRPLFFTAIGLVLGIIVGFLIAESLVLAIVLPLCLATVGIVLSISLKSKTVLFVFLAICLGMTAMIIDGTIYSPDKIEGNMTAEVRILKNYGNGWYECGDLTFDGDEYKGKARFFNNEYDFDVGTLVTLSAKVSTLDATLSDSTEMHKFSKKTFYNLDYTVILEYRAGKKTVFESIKTRLSLAIDEYFSKENAGFVKSLVFGDSYEMTAGDVAVFRGAGVSHIFALSGLHVGFLLGLIYYILKKLRVPQLPSMIISGLILLFYGFLTGFPPGLQRAAIMALCIAAAKILHRKNDGLSTLSLAVIIMLIMSPRQLFDISFYMSVLAVLGIILFYKPVKKLLVKNKPPKIWDLTASAIAMTVSANVFLIPVQFNVFNSFSLYALFANILIVPIVSFIYGYLVSAIVLSAIHIKIGVLLVPMKYPITTIRVIARLIFALPASVLNLASLGLSATFLYCLLALLITDKVQVSKSMKIISLSAMTVCLAAIIIF